MFKAALFITAKSGSHPNVHWLVNGETKCDSSYNGILFAIKSNETLIHAIILLNRKNIILNERSQRQEITYCMISFISNVQKKSNLEKQRIDWLLHEAGCMNSE